MRKILKTLVPFLIAGTFFLPGCRGSPGSTTALPSQITTTPAETPAPTYSPKSSPSLPTANQTPTAIPTPVENPIKNYARSLNLPDDIITTLEPLGIDGMDANEKNLVYQLSVLPPAAYSDSRLSSLLRTINWEKKVTSDEILTLKDYFDTSKYAAISFYYDLNLNNKQDFGEVTLNDLKLDADLYHVVSQNGTISVPRNTTFKLYVSGKAPNGKPLVNITLREPDSVVLLESGFSLNVLNYNSIRVGVADGYLTCPINPSEMSMSGYDSWFYNPSYAQSNVDTYYSKPGWKYKFNYYYYGYEILWGGLNGQPHLAFDIAANPGTEVHAAFGGKIVKGLYDWKFGIQGPSGTVYYNHLEPSIKIGDIVKRYDIVGRIDNSGANHVHFEFNPDAAQILNLWPGVANGAMLTSPFKGEKVFILPYFGK